MREKRVCGVYFHFAVLALIVSVMFMLQPTEKGNRVQLMMTCLCDAFYADVAKATVQVLEYLGCEIVFPEGQTCCGQPAFNAGDWESARSVLRHTEKVFGEKLPMVAPSGSCAVMLRHGAQLAFETASESEQATMKALGQKSWELSEFIVGSLGVKRWPGKFEGRVALHRSCHTRGTEIYDATVQLLESIEGLELVPVGELEQCCGFGGTFSVSFPNISAKMGQLKVEHLTASKPDYVAGLDSACMMHFGGMMDKAGESTPRLHVAQILLKSLQNGGLLS